MPNCIFCELPLEGNNNYCQCENCPCCQHPFCVAFECLPHCSLCDDLLENCNCLECDRCHSVFCTCNFEQYENQQYQYQQTQNQDEEPQQDEYRNDRNNN
jgi:hypothetical protein